MMGNKKIIGEIADRAIALAADGLSNSEIARQIGVDRTSIAPFLARRGIVRPIMRNGREVKSAGPTRKNAAKLPDGMEARIVPHVPGYSVTADGRVWSEFSDPPRQIAPKLNKNMPRVILNHKSKKRYVYTALLVIEAWVGPRPEGHIIGYRDGDKNNVAASNLYWREPSRKVDPKEFIRTWHQASSAMEVAETLGVNVQYVYSTAAAYRKKGVPLKDFSGRRNDVDWEDLIEFAKSLD